MTKPVRRRTVLAAVLGAAGAPLWARAGRAASAETVIVIGAGLAGLAAATLIRDSGRRAIVLEARETAGGRVQTVRTPFEVGLYGEAGASRISDTHSYVLHWINRTGLNLVPFQPGDGHTVFAIDGKRVFADDPKAGEKLLNGLKPAERGLVAGALLNHYVAGLPSDLGEPLFNAAAYARWAPYDQVTWPDWLRMRGASGAAVRLMTLGANSERISALYVLRQIMLHRSGRAYYKIDGGMDRLPQALAAPLSDAIRYGAVVTAIAQDETAVHVTYRHKGRQETVKGARAVIAIPFTTLRDVHVAPTLSAIKGDAVAHMPYRAATRFLLETRTPFWRKAGLSGSARTDGPAELWDGAAGEPSAHGLLSVTAGGTPRVRKALAGLHGAARAQFGVRLAAAAFPDIRNAYQHGFTKDWSEDRWSKGAFAVFYPGQMTRWGAALTRPEGRLHFAGEHTSPWPGWMQGALWSAERVFQEILA